MGQRVRVAHLSANDVQMCMTAVTFHRMWECHDIEMSFGGAAASSTSPRRPAVAAAIAFPCSANAAMATGHNPILDGGYTMK